MECLNCDIRAKENIGLHREIDRLTAQLEQANKDLEKYKGAVEVEGIIHIISEDSIKNGISILSPISMKYNRQRVKVLVMPMEVE